MNIGQRIQFIGQQSFGLSLCQIKKFSNFCKNRELQDCELYQIKQASIPVRTKQGCLHSKRRLIAGQKTAYYTAKSIETAYKRQPIPMQNAMFCIGFNTHFMHTSASSGITSVISSICVCTRKGLINAAGRINFQDKGLLQRQEKSGRKQNLCLACIMAYRNNRKTSCPPKPCRKRRRHDVPHTPQGQQTSASSA